MIATVIDKQFELSYMVKVETQIKNLPVTAINIANGTSVPH